MRLRASIRMAHLTCVACSSNRVRLRPVRLS